MENDWKNNSTIYLQQHSRYYRWVLYPIIGLFCGILLFIILGSSEKVIRSKAQLSSEHIVNIQIPMEAAIKENKLKENLSVKKGDTLIVFDVDDLMKQKEQLTTEIITLTEKNNGIKLLIQSLEEEKNLFTENDSFGYSNQVNAFLKNKEQINQATQQIEDTYQNNLHNIHKNNNQLDEQLTKNQNNLQELLQIRVAWINQQSIQNYSTENMSQYALWQVQMEQTQENEKKQVKATVLAEIDKLITQVNQTIDQLELQKGTIVNPVVPNGEINSQLATIDQVKEQQIAAAKEQQKVCISEKEKNDVTLKSIEKELKNSTLIAPTDGTIHLNSSYEETKNIPKGTIIAEIYPKKEQNQMEIISQIPADQMTHVKKGMPIHVKIDKKGISEQLLDGEITGISETSTNTDQGTFYTVRGVIKTPKNESLRYGLTGDLSLVVGKKTYWNQMIDFMFDRN